jgi:hypothetical protein
MRLRFSGGSFAVPRSRTFLAKFTQHGRPHALHRGSAEAGEHEPFCHRDFSTMVAIGA